MISYHSSENAALFYEPGFISISSGFKGACKISAVSFEKASVDIPWKLFDQSSNEELVVEVWFGADGNGNMVSTALGASAGVTERAEDAPSVTMASDSGSTSSILVAYERRAIIRAGEAFFWGKQAIRGALGRVVANTAPWE
jgi:hypothetical protein